jgi:hypothetical protein
MLRARHYWQTPLPPLPAILLVLHWWLRMWQFHLLLID